jgi:cytosine/adenosine deaminase-related metal-dependent hydrolase
VAIRVVAAPWVLDGHAALADGAVALDGDVVLGAGPRALVEARHGAAERTDAVLLPALVNAHLHLELSHLAGRVPGGQGLVPWIGALVEARLRGGPVEEAMIRAAASLTAAGVAAVGDVTNTLASMAPLAREGIGGTLFHEVFGYAEARCAEAERAAAEARSRLGPPPPGLSVAPSPHAVYSTHPAALARLLRAGPASIHVAEDPGEREFCARATGPFAGLVAKLGVEPAALAPTARSAVAAVAPHLGPATLVVHAVDVDDEDRAALRRSGATVVLCPRSNRAIGGRLPDLPRLLAAGIPLAVGTDSLASAPSLAPLEELAALRAAFPEVPASSLLPLAWNGAAVGAPWVGRLAPGAAPGLLSAPLGGARPDDPFAWLLDVHGASGRPLGWLARPRPAAPSRGAGTGPRAPETPA